MDIQTMSVRLPMDLYERLRREAFELRVPMSDLIRQGVELRLAPDKGTFDAKVQLLNFRFKETQR